MASTIYRTDGQCAGKGCRAPVNEGSTFCPSCEFDLAQFAAECGGVVQYTPSEDEQMWFERSHRNSESRWHHRYDHQTSKKGA